MDHTYLIKPKSQARKHAAAPVIKPARASNQGQQRIQRAMGNSAFARFIQRSAKDKQTVDEPSPPPERAYFEPPFAQDPDGEGLQVGWKRPDYSLKLPPLKISRWVYSYLVTNNMMLPEFQQMLLKGEIEIDWTESDPSFQLSPEGAGEHGLRLSRELGLLRMRLGNTGTSLPPPDPAPTLPVSPPKESGPPFFEWKGLTEGINLRVPYLNPNISFSGLTVDVLKKGQFDMKAVAGWTGSIEVQMTYRDWHLTGSVDKEGKWLVKLTYPSDTPIPDASALKNIFQQGERALEEAVKTAGSMLDKPDFGAVKDKVSVLADPLKNTVDAAKGVAKAGSGVNVSLVIGAGPAPGQLPEEMLRGVEPPAATKQGFYGGLTLTYVF